MNRQQTAPHQTKERKTMPKDETILGNYHHPSSDSHPTESVGNQQIFDNGDQVGAIEYTPNSNGSFDLSVTNTAGDTVTKL
jgi:hypothetical protein